RRSSLLGFGEALQNEKGRRCQRIATKLCWAEMAYPSQRLQLHIPARRARRGCRLLARRRPPDPPSPAIGTPGYRDSKCRKLIIPRYGQRRVADYLRL